MATRAYSEINLHLVWHVKQNSPVLHHARGQAHERLERISPPDENPPGG